MEKTNHTKALQLLNEKFEEIRLRNPRWSQRALAQRLGLSSGALSEILRGKRSLNLKTKKRILENLEFSPRERNDFLEDDLIAPLEKPTLEYMQLSQDQFHLISDWWHFGLLNLVKTKSFKPDIFWIGQRLNLPAKIINEAWERLFRMGFLIKQAGGKIARKHPRLSTSDHVFNLSVRKSHLEDLKLIEKSILDLSPSERDVVSMTLAIRKEDLPKAQDLIRQFRDEFGENLETKNPNEVYKLTVAFYPLTVITKEVHSHVEN